MKAAIYVIATKDYSALKIGIALHPQRRLMQVQVGNHVELVLFWSKPVNKARLLETHLHHCFRGERLWGEWFKSSPSAVVEEAERVIARRIPDWNEKISRQKSDLKNAALREARATRPEQLVLSLRASKAELNRAKWRKLLITSTSSQRRVAATHAATIRWQKHRAKQAKLARRRELRRKLMEAASAKG